MKKLTMFVCAFSGEEPDFFIFLAQEDCDRVKEFKYAYKHEMGENYPYGDVYPEMIYNITTAYDYRAKNDGGYTINLIKD
jgi:hypothetical protein